MRLSIVKKHHQQLLLEIASSLRSNDPKDALEHILNCWVHPCLQTAQATVPIQSLTSSQVDDDVDTLASWD